MPDQDVKDESEDKKPDAPPANKKELGSLPAASIVLFKNKVEIHSDKRAQQYDVGKNKAYKACAKDKNQTPLIAIVCERHLVPRRADAKVYKDIINPALTTLVLNGPVFWPLAKQERYVLIYLDNLGAAILPDGQPAALGWKQDDVMVSIVKPMVDILQDFRDKDFVHGSIRPGNMFNGGEAGIPKKIILGDCLSVPSSYVQPSLYESIERSMADPIARGKGTLADDLYAFGVSLSVIMRQRDPMQDFSELDVIKQKITVGSYSAVTGKDRFKGEILELLRGLLHDEPSQRWTIDEVLVWLDGRRLTPKQSILTKKAPRPINLGGRKYFLTPLLAMDIEKVSSEVKKSIEDQSMHQWIERSLEDEEALERFEKAIVDSRQQSIGANYEHCLVSNLSIAFDPSAPLRFKGMRLMGDGIGAAMVEATVLKQPLGPLAEVFTNSLVLNWLVVQNQMSVDVTGLFKKFEKCRHSLKTNKFGEGVERCIYLLSPESPCLSEIVKDYFVAGPADLLLAFESLCQQAKAPERFLDRHSIAFLYQKDAKVLEPFLYDLNTQVNHKVVLATLKCLASIQKRYDVGDVPGVSKVLAGKLPAVVRRYHDRRVQDKLKDEIEEFSSSGNLKKMAAILDNAEVLKKDFTSFRKAMLEFRDIEQERQNLEVSLENKESFGTDTGREVASVVACVLSAIIILGTAFMFLSDKSPF